ncbi:MAG TPA: alpha-amylase, partial [Actinobacteria bacterium]|nr:alpha-amylase [Actinomycetota bacterium]
MCCYFHVHQPLRVKKYNLFDIGSETDYFDDKKNSEILRKVANKCYYPANNLMLELIERSEGRFKISYSISGVFLDQAMEFEPKIIESFQRLAQTGCV